MEHRIGERRDVPGFRGPQTNFGPCAVCGQCVWVYDDDPRKDEPPVHKRTCVPGGAFYEASR
jgi:hypothetical protein